MKEDETAKKYSGMRIRDALCAFLDETSVAHPQNAIEDELAGGGAIAGKAQPKIQIGKSVDRLIRTGMLRKVGDKIGRAEWGDERFR